MHKPVLLDETIKALQVKKGGKYIDATLGDGGHTLEILRLGGRVLGLDLDDGSLQRACGRIEKEGLSGKFVSVKGNFKDIENLALQNGFKKVDGILYDLGYSSSQLEDDAVGISFQSDQPLDMRLDKNLGVTAADLINASSGKELTNLFSVFGEERYSKTIAKAIVEARKLKRLETTKQLADVVAKASPGYESRLHPATRVFQALRIVVNDELENLKISLPRAARLLLPGGRIAVICFHSLEDRIAKQFKQSVQPDIAAVNDKPIQPSQHQLDENPRSRSARLRIYEKIENGQN